MTIRTAHTHSVPKKCRKSFGYNTRLLKTFGPTKVSVEGCEDVDDFLKEIKKIFALSVPVSRLTLYQPDGTTEIDVGDSPALFAAENSRNTPLVVKIIETDASKKRVTFEERMLSRFDSLAPIVSDFVRRYYYVNDNATKADKRDPKFKHKLIEFYSHKIWANPTIKCMLTGIELPSQIVIASHLFKFCWGNDCRARLGFDDINSPRNGLLWFKPLANAFDNSHICYHYDVESDSFLLKILDSRLRSLTFKQYFESKDGIENKFILQRTKEQWLTEFSKKPNETSERISDEKIRAVDNLMLLLDKPISEFEGKSLMKTEEKCYQRCLSFQASMARLVAIENGWITKDEPGDSSEMYSDLEESKKNDVRNWLKTVENLPETTPIED